MALKEPGYGEGVTQEEYDKKLAELRGRRAEGGKSWNEFLNKLEMWTQDDMSELDMEYQAEFLDWPIARVRAIYAELLEDAEGEEEEMES